VTVVCLCMECQRGGFRLFDMFAIGGILHSLMNTRLGRGLVMIMEMVFWLGEKEKYWSWYTVPH
jgi:hypothetical protein